MNKKVLTLCASFLLAGGLTSSVFAETFQQAVANHEEGQYFYVNVNGQGKIDGGTWTNENSDQLDVNGSIDNPDAVYTKEENRSTWFRLEPVKHDVNGTNTIVGYKLINALTGKAYSVEVKNADGSVTVYDTFKNQNGKLAFAKADGTTLGYFNNGQFVSSSNDAWYYSLEAVPVQNLDATQINKVKNGYFGLQFGFINAQGAYENYASVEGATPFAGDLVAQTQSFGENIPGVSTRISPVSGSYFIFNKTQNAYVVLLKEKWSDFNTDLDPATKAKGFKFALMTAGEIIADQLKPADQRTIASWSFNVNMPVVKDYSPLEVIAKNVYDDGTGLKDVELLISNVNKVNYLTTQATLKVDEAENPNKTNVRFGGTDYSDMSEFYGWAITIKGIKGTGVEGMTLKSDVPVDTDVEGTWTKAEYVAFSRPEAQWIVTSKNGTIELTNRETKKHLRWNEAFDMIGGGNLTLRRESGDIYVTSDNQYKFEIKKVAELGGYTIDHYGRYDKDESEIGIGRTYKVTFNDAFGVPTYVGIDGTGNVLLTRDEAQAINFDVIKTQTTDTLLNNGAIAENAQEDVFYIINNYMKYNEDTKEWNYTVNGDTLAYYRYELAYGDKFLKYNEAKKSFELVKENVVYTDATTPANVANKVVDYGKSTLADNFVIKLKENDKLNIVKVINYEMEDILAGVYSATESNSLNSNKVIYKLGSDSEAMFANDDVANNQEGEKLLANGEMVFFDFNNAEAQKQQNIYYWNANAQLSIDLNKFDTYRYFANPDTLEFYRTEYNDEFLYENTTVTDKGTINYLDMTYNRDEYNAAIYLDTAYIKDTKKPTYLLAVDVDIEPAHKYCPDHGLDADCKDEHLLTIPAYTTGRYLVSFTDSVAAHAAELKNPYLVDNKYTTLGFVDASHRVDSLYLLQNGDTVKNYTLTNAAARTSLNPVEFAFRIVNQLTQDFVIETTILDGGVYVPAYVRWHNAMPVLTTDITDAEVFNVRETSSNPTANEEITAEGNVIVAGTNGAVVVKGAEGKNVIVSTILGKVVANEVVSSDNATIAAPAGVVVVSVDGESFKVVVK